MAWLTTLLIYTFNDDVAWENVSFLIQCYQVLGDQRLLDPIMRGMNFFLLVAAGCAEPGLVAAVHARPQAGRGPHL